MTGFPHSGVCHRRTLILGIGATAIAGAPAEAAVPQPFATNLVVASRRSWNGRDCLALELTDEEQEGRLLKTRSPNGPSFAVSIAISPTV